MTRRGRATTVLLTALAFALGAAGCGGDDDDETTTPFEINLPESSVQSETTTENDIPAPTEQTTTEDGGGTGGTGGTGSGNVDPSKEDSETNDKPPPAGSPQEAFEQECERNPAACG